MNAWTVCLFSVLSVVSVEFQPHICLLEQSVISFTPHMGLVQLLIMFTSTASNFRLVQINPSFNLLTNQDLCTLKLITLDTLIYTVVDQCALLT